MEPARQVDITECTIRFTGAQIVQTIQALHDLPYKIANPIILSIEGQIRAQFPAPEPDPAASTDEQLKQQDAIDKEETP